VLQFLTKVLFLSLVAIHIATYFGFALSFSYFLFFFISLLALFIATFVRKSLKNEKSSKDLIESLSKFRANQILISIALVIYIFINLIYCNSIVRHASFDNGNYTEMVMVQGKRKYNEISEGEYLRRLPYKVRLATGLMLGFNLVLLGLQYRRPLTKQIKSADKN